MVQHRSGSASATAASIASRNSSASWARRFRAIIPNGIDGQRFANAKVSLAYSQGPTVGFIGRFEEPRKGLQVLIDSLAIVARFVPDVQYIVAGPGDSQEFLKKLNS